MATKEYKEKQEEEFEKFNEELSALLRKYDLQLFQTYDGAMVTFNDDDDQKAFYI